MTPRCSSNFLCKFVLWEVVLIFLGFLTGFQMTGQYLAGSSYLLGRGYLWDAHSHSLVSTLNYGKSNCDLYFSSDRSKLVVALYEGQVDMFDLTGVDIEGDVEISNDFAKYRVDADFINCVLNRKYAIHVSFGNSGNSLLLRQGFTLYYVDLANRMVVWSYYRFCWDARITADDVYVLCVVGYLCESGDTLSDSAITLIVAATGEELFYFEIDAKWWLRLCLDNSEQTMATWREKSVLVWDVNLSHSVASQKLSVRGELKGHSSTILCAEHVGDNRLITGSHDCTARIWNVITCEELHCIRFDDGYPSSMSCSPQINQVAVLLQRTKGGLAGAAARGPRFECFELQDYNRVACVGIGDLSFVAYISTSSVILL